MLETLLFSIMISAGLAASWSEFKRMRIRYQCEKLERADRKRREEMKR